MLEPSISFHAVHRKSFWQFLSIIVADSFCLSIVFHGHISRLNSRFRHASPAALRKKWKNASEAHLDACHQWSRGFWSLGPESQTAFVSFGQWLYVVLRCFHTNWRVSCSPGSAQLAELRTRCAHPWHWNSKPRLWFDERDWEDGDLPTKRSGDSMGPKH
jgi:hypothetical protein